MRIRHHALPLVFVALAGGSVTVAQTAQPGPVRAKAGFDITRFSTAGNDWFETFHVNETRPLRQALDANVIAEDTRVLVTETAQGKLALLTEQMAYHHIAQGHAGGKDWMATF